MKLVHVISDPLPNALSVNKRVAARFVSGLQAAIPGLSIDEVELRLDPPPYYDMELFRFVWEAVSDPQYQPSPSEQAAAAYMQRHAQRLRDADLLLLSAPVWNFFLPAVLKAWVDQVLSPGEMFSLGEQGRAPLHRIRAMVSVVSAGGWMSEQGHDRSMFELLQAMFAYAGIERHHELLIEGQEPALFSDHAQRETESIAVAEQLARDLAGEYSASS